jgi:predicted O-methyltransferase YrrM
MKNFFKKLFDGSSRAIGRSLACKGWTDERKLSVLFDLAKKAERLDGDILEIGSAWGRSTVLLGLSSHKTIWSIDPHTGGLASIKTGEPQNSYDEFIRNLAKNGILDRVRIVRNTTQNVVSKNLIPREVRFAFVFIDGLHTAEGVQVDFNYSYDRLATGAVMIFDDYYEPSVQDYSSMIDSLLKNKKITAIKDDEAKLIYFYKPNN